MNRELLYEIKDIVCIGGFILLIGVTVVCCVSVYKELRTQEMNHISELISGGTEPLAAKCAIESSC